MSGVASGDPTTTSIVLWGRLEHAPASVAWTVAGPDGTVAATGTAHPDGYGVVNVGVDGLTPGTSYDYWFDTDGLRSAIGRTRTLAERPTSVRLGVACCARLPGGDFTGYRSLAERAVDLMVHLGDYIYEDGDGGERGAHVPPHECTTIDDYERRFTQYRADPDLRDLHAAAPWVATLDDHEIDDDVARFTRSGNGTADGVDPERRRAGAEVHARWMPQRPHGNGPTPRDRLLSMGDLCDLVLVDTRLGGREPHVGDGGPTRQPTPARSPQLLSDDQWAWLDEVIGGSSATWLLIASQVQVAPLRLGWWPARSRAGRWPLRMAPIVNPDQWDGYPTERQRLVDLLDTHDRHDVVVLSGDLHGRFVTSTPRNGRPPLAEVTTPAISAPTFGSLLDAHLPIPSRWTARWLDAINPHIHHLDLEHHGATVVDIDADSIRFSDAVRPEAWEWTLQRTRNRVR